MAFFKKNLAFCVIVIVSVLVFAAGSYLTFAESGNLKKAERKIASNETQLKGLLSASPALTAENVEAAEDNVAQLAAALQTIRDDLQRGSRLTTSTDSIGVMAAVQQYISEYQKMVADHVNAEGASTPIAIPEDFAFGFEQYIDETGMFDDADKASTIDKQRQILSYLVTQLIQANPQGIGEIQREVLEIEGDDSFVIDPLVSARVPDAIDTMAFSLTFDGYTDSLRSFLNKLAAFDLPIVVRSISVTRPAGKQTVVAPSSGGNLDSIFGIFGDAGEASNEPAEVQKPVIEDNVSTFTVIVEFIEVVLPDTATDELS